MKTNEQVTPIYYLFGYTSCRKYEIGLDEVREYMSTCGGDAEVFMYDENMSPSKLLSAFSGYNTFIEITEDEYNILINDRVEFHDIMYFHIDELDNTDTGSLGIIRGYTNYELNKALKRVISDVYETEIDFEAIDFTFWEKRHTEEVVVTLTVNDIAEIKTFRLTYTWLV